MTGYPGSRSSSSINLQTTLAAGSAMSAHCKVHPHHPIMCVDKLSFDPDGLFECPHAAVPAGSDERTRHVVNHSVALLILECAGAL